MRKTILVLIGIGAILLFFLLLLVGSSESGVVTPVSNSINQQFVPTPVPTPKPKCISYRVRTGAICRDGWESSATGSGACSHHGGVSYWLTTTICR